MIYTDLQNNQICFECEQPSTQNHHVLPVILGGTKTIPLCDKCHNLIHYGIDKKFTHSDLVKAGIKRVQKEGKHFGKKQEIDISKVLELKKTGLSNRSIAKELNRGITSINYIVNNNK